MEQEAAGILEPAARAAWVWSLERRLRWPSWLLSCLVHLSLLVALGLTVQHAPRGFSDEPARAGGIALVSQTAEGRTDYLTAGAPAAGAATGGAAAASGLPAATESPVDLAGALAAESGDVGAALPGDIGSAEGLTQAPQGGGRIGGRDATTSVFGVQGTGNKFVYVFDRSASMGGYDGRPLAAAKAQLIASLAPLDEHHQFQIVFYNSRPSIFNPFHPNPPRLMVGDSATKEQAERFVRGIEANGSTSHMDALRLALSMSPDVVFFLTDAADPQLTSRQLEEIQRRNQGGATIHAIEFGAGPFQGGHNFLMQLARDNGGAHQYVDVTRLPGN